MAKSYSRIWLRMSCRCAVRFANFIFAPVVDWGPNMTFLWSCWLWRGQMRVDKRRFFLSGKIVNWIPSTFQIVDKWYSRIWLGMSCRCVIRFRNFYFEIRVEKRRFFSESCYLSFMYISRNSKQIICQNVIGQALQMPNKIQEVTFCPLRYKRNF